MAARARLERAVALWGDLPLDAIGRWRAYANERDAPRGGGGQERGRVRGVPRAGGEVPPDPRRTRSADRAADERVPGGRDRGDGRAFARVPSPRRAPATGRGRLLRVVAQHAGRVDGASAPATARAAPAAEGAGLPDPGVRRLRGRAGPRRVPRRGVRLRRTIRPACHRPGHGAAAARGGGDLRAGYLCAMFLFLAPVVCLDPGHSSEVGPGTRGRSLTELHANWIVALRLKGLLERDGFRVGSFR